MEPGFDDKLFDTVLIGAQRIGEFLEATRGVAFDEEASRLRDQAKVALSVIVTNIYRQAGRYHLIPEDLRNLERFTSKEFLEG